MTNELEMANAAHAAAVRKYQQQILDYQRDIEHEQLNMKSEHVNTTLQERGSKYGPFTGHAEVTQDLKNVLRCTPGWERLHDDQKEALEMIAHKIGRIVNGDPDYDDSWRDIAGYAMLVCNRLTGKGPV